MTSYTFSQLIDFTRTTSATYVNSAGLIATTPASVNLLTYTQEFDNAAWSKNNVTITANSTTAPDGTTTADKLAETATTAVHNAGQSITTTAQVYTFSCYVKAAERNFALLYHTQSNASVSVDLTTGATGTASGTVAPISFSVTSVGNGWWRVAMTVTATAASNFFGVYAMNDLVYSSYAGTAGSGIYVWGAQVEQVPDASLTLGSELRGGGTTSIVGSPTPTVTYNSSTGAAVISRTDASNTGGVSVPVGGANRLIRIAITIASINGVVQVRGTSPAGTILLSSVGNAPGTYVVYVISDSTDIYLVMGGNGTTASLTVDSVKQVTAITGMPSTYTRNFGGLYPPRFDYDPVTLQPKGLLIEEQRTNLLLYSAQFDNASWVKSNSTVTANATTSPDGTVNAEKLIPSAASGDGRVVQTFTGSAGTTYTLSIYAKQGEFTNCRVYADDSATNTVSVSYNLATGTVSTAVAVAGGNWTSASSTITAAGNGWWRITLTWTATAVAPTRAAFWCRDTGDGTSGIFLYGAQLEAGAFATSYIPTVASQVTRTADIAAIQAPNFASWFNGITGTFYLEFDRFTYGVNSVYYGLSTTDGASTNLVGFMNYGTGVNERVFAGGVDTATLSGGNPAASAVVKAAAVYGAADYAISVNGAAAVTQSTGSAPSSLNRLNIGSLNSSNFLNGHIRSIRYYPTRLTNAQLQALTA